MPRSRLTDRTANIVRAVLREHGASAADFARDTRQAESSVNYRINHMENDLAFLRRMINVYDLTDVEIIKVVKG